MVHWQEKPSFEYWSPFLRLAFSASGESLAGINLHCFELRYAHSGGLNKCVFSAKLLAGPARLRRVAPSDPPARNVLLSFPRQGERVVFGWDSELRIMETHAGNVLRWLTSPGDPFVDVSFMGLGKLIATVDGTPLMRLWSEEACVIVHEFDWDAGALTCLAPTADGLAGVCGTADGQLVVFDVEE